MSDRVPVLQPADVSTLVTELQTLGADDPRHLPIALATTEVPTGVRRACQTCRHWQPPHERGDFDVVVRTNHDIDETNAEFDALEALGEEADKLYGRCGGIEQGRVEVTKDTRVDELPVAVTQDASDYQSTVWTRGEFSCALHEPDTAREAS